MELICIGQMKAGTTWLYETLRESGKFNCPFIKEIHFWDELELIGVSSYLMRSDEDVMPMTMSDTIKNRWRANSADFKNEVTKLQIPFKKNESVLLDWWKCFYFGSKDIEWYKGLINFSEKCFIDITPTYDRCSKGTVDKIYKEFPNAKIIYITRANIERAISHIMWSLAHGSLSESDFESLDIFTKLWLDPYGSKSGLIDIKNYPSIDYVYKNWEPFISTGRFLRIEYEDIAKNPEFVIKTLSNFLNIELEIDIEIISKRYNEKITNFEIPKEIIEFLKINLL
jgi:hypothetical protein